MPTAGKPSHRAHAPESGRRREPGVPAVREATCRLRSKRGLPRRRTVPWPGIAGPARIVRVPGRPSARITKPVQGYPAAGTG
ncbi:hypothetical protein C1I97_00570 [Streptomyces sp. NTH33]|nr:hypothetical protein C1I97_00570 [Streptomyces sp. NTH33]